MKLPSSFAKNPPNFLPLKGTKLCSLHGKKSVLNFMQKVSFFNIFNENNPQPKGLF